MRIAYAILSPLLLLGGCATTGAGPHAHGAQGEAMQNCPMMSASADGERQQGAMMGDHAGQMSGQGQMMQGQMMQGMHHGDMSNCPMAQGASPPPPPAADDPHQH
jgi:hypothetical protein